MLNNIIKFKSKAQIEEEKTKTEAFNELTGKWETAMPESYYYGLLPFLWRRLTGYKDKYGRKAHFIGWSEFSLF